MRKQIRRDRLDLNRDGMIARLARALIVANKEIAFQAVEKGNRAAELIIANEELAFQTVEKGKRADELVIANEELAFQKEFSSFHSQRCKEHMLAEKALSAAQLFHEAVLDSVQEGVIVYGLDLRYQEWNPFMEQLTGKLASEVLGKHPLELFPFLGEVGVIDQLKKALDGEDVLPLDLPFEVPSTGRSGWAVNGSATLRDQKGKIIGVIGTVTDITERKMAELALRKVSATLEQSPVGIVITDTAGAIEYVNPAHTQMSGYTFEELKGQNSRILKSGRASSEDYQSLWRTILAGEVWRGEFCNRKKNGDVYYQKASISPVRDAHGVIVNFVGVKEDITEQKRRTEENRQLQAQLFDEKERANQLALQAENASQAKSEFLANMSHEIRTPMNGLIGMIGLLEKAPLDALHHHYVESARTCGQQLLTIINDILDLSKIEAGKVELEEVEFSLEALLAELHLLLSSRADEKSLVLFLGLLPGTPDRLRGDPTRLKQVLLNLIGNALKFTAKGAVLVQVEALAGSADEVRLRFRVTDTGIGIPADMLGEVFEKFTQADGSTTRNYGGTGLGLAISRQLVALMGGEIGVSSEKGWGSEFWFTAQLRLAAQEASDPAPALDALMPRRELGLLRVLLAEDNYVNQLLTVALLKEWGVTVDVVGDGLQALEALRQNRYDLVLMDIQMPGMDGLTATAQLRKPESGVLDPRVPVVALTAHAMREDRQRCLDAGMDDYLSKPINPDILLEVLHRHLAVSGMRSRASARPAPALALAGAAHASVFDSEDFVARLLGNQQAAAEILQTFLVAAPTILTQIEHAVTVPDPQVVGQLLHSLAGSSATVGGMGLCLQAKKLEQTLLAREFASVAAGLPVLFDEFERFKEAAQAFVA